MGALDSVTDAEYDASIADLGSEIPARVGVARALAREAAGTAGSYLPPSAGDATRVDWTLRLLEAMVEEDGSAEETLTRAGIAAIDLKHFHHRWDDYFRPLVVEAFES